MSANPERMIANHVYMFEKLLAGTPMTPEREAQVGARLTSARRAHQAILGEDRARALMRASRLRLGGGRAAAVSGWARGGGTAQSRRPWCTAASRRTSRGRLLGARAAIVDRYRRCRPRRAVAAAVAGEGEGGWWGWCGRSWVVGWWRAGCGAVVVLLVRVMPLALAVPPGLL